MISEIFEYYYTNNMYPERLKPLTREELSEGMLNDTIDKYLSLIKELYDSFFYDVNIQFEPLKPELRHQKYTKQSQVYNSLINHLFKNDAISDTAYVELHETMPIEFNFTERPDNPLIYVCDSLDDFRLAFELSILESDEHVNLSNLYLMDRYGYYICGRPNILQKKWITSSDLCIYRAEDLHQSPVCEEISYWEARQLLSRIQQDMKHNADEQTHLDADFCKSKNSHLNSISSLQKSTYKSPKNIAEWYTIKRALEVEGERLFCLEHEIKGIFEGMKKPENTAGSAASLYIYKGKIVCHHQKHPIVPATAILQNKYDKEIQIDIEYCPKCKRYMINHTSFEHYRERYGILIGKLRMITSNGAGGEFDLALESPLKLCGYNVSQTDGLSTATRQFILAKIIHDGIMSKLEVIRYLEHFINMNGSKKGNSLAVEKWYEDLDFVHNYDIIIQPTVYITTIKEY